MPENTEFGWDTLLRGWRDELMRRGEPQTVPAPAAAEAVRAAQDRLGTTLPAELRERTGSPTGCRS